MEQSFEVNFVDGLATGLWVVESEFCVVGALKAPRLRLKEVLQRDESSGPGVYILADGGKEQAYIGETNELENRIKTHNRKLDWWEEMLWITATSGKFQLGTDRRRYIESCLVNQVPDREILKNIQAQMPRLQLSAQDKERIDKEVVGPICDMLLPMMGFDFILPPTQTPPQSDCPEFEVYPLTEGIQAFAKFVDGKWIVQKGSQARKDWKGGVRGDRIVEGSYYKLYQDLIKQEILVLHKDGKHRIFAKDYEFNSSSAAAAVIYGRQAAGPRNWKVKGQDKTYQQWEEENL